VCGRFTHKVTWSEIVALNWLTLDIGTGPKIAASCQDAN
jgi:hypothetical protein